MNPYIRIGIQRQHDHHHLWWSMCIIYHPIKGQDVNFIFTVRRLLEFKKNDVKWLAWICLSFDDASSSSGVLRDWWASSFALIKEGRLLLVGEPVSLSKAARAFSVGRIGWLASSSSMWILHSSLIASFCAWPMPDGSGTTCSPNCFFCSPISVIPIFHHPL